MIFRAAIFFILSITVSCCATSETELTYVVTGVGRADIEWTNLDEDICSSYDTELPWSITYIVPSSSVSYALLKATRDSSAGYIDLKIYIDGDELRSASADGPSAFGKVTYP